MPTRHPLPFVPLDSLYRGDELRITRIEGPILFGVFEELDLDGMGEMLLRLSVTGGTQLLRCREIVWRDGLPCIQRIQYTREVNEVYEGQAALASVMEHEGRTV